MPHAGMVLRPVNYVHAVPSSPSHAIVSADSDRNSYGANGLFVAAGAIPRTPLKQKQIGVTTKSEKWDIGNRKAWATAERYDVLLSSCLTSRIQIL